MHCRLILFYRNITYGISPWIYLSPMCIAKFKANFHIIYLEPPLKELIREWARRAVKWYRFKKRILLASLWTYLEAKKVYVKWQRSPILFYTTAIDKFQVHLPRYTREIPPLLPVWAKSSSGDMYLLVEVLSLPYDGVSPAFLSLFMLLLMLVEMSEYFCDCIYNVYRPEIK